MSDFSDRLELLRQLAFYNAGGGKKTGIQDFTDLLTGLGTGVKSAGEGLQAGAKGYLDVAKAATAEEPYYKQALPNLPPVSKDEAAKKLFEQQKATRSQAVQKNLSDLFQQRGFASQTPTPSETDIASQGIPEVSPLVLPRQSQIEALQARTPFNVYLPTDEGKKVGDIQQSIAMANYYNSQAGNLIPQYKEKSTGNIIYSVDPSLKNNPLYEPMSAVKPNQAGTGTIAQARFGIEKQKFEMSKLSPQALQEQVNLYDLSGNLPQLGMGGLSIRSQIMNQHAKQMEANGNSAGALLERRANFAAGQAELTKLQQQRGLIGAFEKTATKNLDNFLSLVDKIPDVNSPILNTPIRELASKFAGDPNITAFNTGALVAQTEIAKVLSGSMASILSDNARQEAQAALNPAGATINQIKSAAAVLKSDMKNRNDSFEEQIKVIRENIGSGGGGGGDGNIEQPPVAAQAAIRAANGKAVTFANGQSWKWNVNKFEKVK